MVTYMLKLENMPKSFRAETVTCAIYISKRCLTKILPEIILEKVWNGRRLFVCHHRLFRSIAFSQVPNQLRKKFNNKI